MRYGIPVHKSIRVEENGQAEVDLKREHHILWTGEARGNTWEVTYCDETPSGEICGHCAFSVNCKFAAREMKG